MLSPFLITVVVPELLGRCLVFNLSILSFRSKGCLDIMVSFKSRLMYGWSDHSFLRVRNHVCLSPESWFPLSPESCMFNAVSFPVHYFLSN